MSDGFSTFDKKKKNEDNNFWTKEYECSKNNTQSENVFLRETVIFLIDCVYKIRSDEFNYADELKLDEFQNRLRKL